MKFKFLSSSIILLSIGILYSCNEDSTKEIIETPPSVLVTINPEHGYYGFDTSFSITSYLSGQNTSESNLKLNWFINNKLCQMCELEEFTDLSSFNIKFESSQVDEDKRIDLLLFVTNESGLNSSVTKTFIFENKTPVIDFKISPGSGPATETLPIIFDLSNSTDAFGGKDLILKLDRYDNGSWDYERSYEDDSSFLITMTGFTQNGTTKIKAQIEDRQGYKATETKSVRLEHGIVIIE